MKKEISRQSKLELTEAIRQRYLSASKSEKTRILDEFVAMTRYHRKHAIRVLTTDNQQSAQERPCGKRIYDEAVKEALIVLWEASDRICGKRLKAILPILVEAMERNGHLDLDAEVQSRLLQMSASTIDRLLTSVRQQAKGRKKKRNAPKKASKQIPVKTFADWDEAIPGELEIDFVVHCGDTTSGSCIHSLVGTDVCSGWTEAVPLLAREQSLTAEGLDVIAGRFPVPVIGLNPDNDGAFINDTLLDYCEGKGLKFTRSRPHQKNDQAWVEQKNGAIVRRLVGYGRLSGVEATKALAKLYASSRLYINFFQPSFKLKSKTRDGAHVHKVYFTPATPYDRLQAHGSVLPVIKEKLQAQFKGLDPVRLLQEIRLAQKILSELAAHGVCTAQAPTGGDDVTAFMASLTTAWKDGEVRPTHRKQPNATHWWRTRVDPFADAWPVIEGWLIAEPSVPAYALMDRLAEKFPQAYASKAQLRTLQRRVKEWRAERAKEMILGRLFKSASPAAHV